jgi:hypothetical protein
MKTVTGKDGRNYLAKEFDGTLCKMTYVNRTQAEKAAEKVGGDVYKNPMYRPFYVVVR